MVKFLIQPDSEIPASNQLYNQIMFAIASRKYPPGHKLPSTRQLAMQTGLHRNTISKVYRQLEDNGLVAAQAGSGIYVREQGEDQSVSQRTPLVDQYPKAYQDIRQLLDDLLKQGCSLSEARDLFLAEIDWRLRCSARVLVTVPNEDLGAGQLMVQELERSFNIPIQLVPLEELEKILEKTRSGTVVTSRYFMGTAEAIASPKAVRVIPVDVYDYTSEIQLLSQLKPGTCVGIVSLSSGLLRGADVMIRSLMGERLLLMSTQPSDSYKLRAIARSAALILCDRASDETVKKAVFAVQEDLIRHPRVVCCENFISTDSINLLRRELGLD
ncbi:MAG: GntR family transcriptional regulator [Synechococcales cyanobacterium RU_4_20]|nr:GntR family transcriptional regulator [Synechococcales cyanobacterium RU_4_20]NJR67605.1 GntR family transcriptional regulator [Synechococcales cyanobacterium CRU_2_2]